MVHPMRLQIANGTDARQSDVSLFSDISMPIISEFFGIVIKIHYDDHHPPHFHAFYGEYSAQISIRTFDLIAGELPRRVMNLTMEWALDHRDELLADWDLASIHAPLKTIEPLT